MGGRGGAPMRAQQNAPAASAGATGPAGQILDALRSLMSGRLKENPDLNHSSNWISLATLREALPGISRLIFDREVTKMSIGAEPMLTTIPVANRKSLKKRHWDGGVSVGGEISHVTRIRNKKDL